MKEMRPEQQKILSGICYCLLAVILLVFAYQEAERRRIAEEEYRAAMAQLRAELQEGRERITLLNQAYAEARMFEKEQRKDPAFQEETVHTTALPVNAIGDSVMLGAVPVLRETFPNGYFDAEVNRSYYPLLNILSSRLEAGVLQEPVVIGIGTNGPLPLWAAQQAVEMCGERQVFWITTNNNYQFYNTDTILSLADTYDNVTIIDWDTASAGHGEYFGGDGIHLTAEGKQAYTDLIRNALTERLFSLIPEEEKGILLIGDDRLQQAAVYLQDMEDVCVYAEEELSADSILAFLKDLREKDILPAHVYCLCPDDEELIRTLRESIPDLSLIENTDDLERTVDGIHLSASGAEELALRIRKQLSE